MDRLIDIQEFRKFRESRINKFLSLFLTDHQKSCILENVFISGFVVLTKIKYFRNEVSDGEQIYMAKTDDYRFLIIREKDGKRFRFTGPDKSVAIAKKKGFFQTWDEMNFPNHIVEFVEKSKNIKEVKNALQKIMKMKAFW